MITQALATRFDVALYVLSLNDTQRLIARVCQPERQGGHNVPALRILDRNSRSMATLKKAARLADLPFVDDAVDVDKGAYLMVDLMVAMRETQQTSVLVNKPPAWVDLLLGKC